MQTKFNENASFDFNNRNNLIKDFYDFYYLIELEKEKVVNDKFKTSDDKDKLSYYDILTEGYELFSKDILHAIALLMDLNSGLEDKELELDIMDYTTTLYGLLLSMYEDNIDKTEEYQDWLVMFDNLVQESYFKSGLELNNN